MFQVLWLFFWVAFAISLGGMAYMEISDYLRRERYRKMYMRGVKR